MSWFIYAFVCALSLATADALGKKRLSILFGVLSDNDPYLKDLPPYSISRNHFLIDKVDGRYVVVDRGSRLGTIVNGSRVDVQSVLKRKESEIIAGPHHSPFVFKLEIR